MLIETRNRPTVQTFRTVRGLKYRVRKVETFHFTAYRVDAQWVEPRSTREENAFIRQGLACVHIATTHETLSRDGTRSLLITRDIRGDYADVCEYLDAIACVGTVSHRDRSGLFAETFLAGLE